MGSMKQIPLFGTSFNEWCPIIVLIVALLTLFNLHGRILRCLGAVRYDSAGAGKVTADEELALREAEMILGRERRKRQPAPAASSSRRRAEKGDSSI